MKIKGFRSMVLALGLVLTTLVGVSRAAPPEDATPKIGQIRGVINYCVPGSMAKTNIYIPKYSFFVKPDNTGAFVIYSVPVGTYSIVFDFPNHTPYQKDNVVVQSNQITDLGIITVCRDLDGDSYTEDVDCRDNNPSVYPGATELCDGIDNNCDNIVDEGCQLCTDADLDGFYSSAGCGTVVDCNDTNPLINPTAQELCNGIDDNCDQVVDEGFDLSSDPSNCGACGNVCSFANGLPACLSGQCALGGCLSGFDDCDGNTANGCEADLTSDNNHCGACGTVCPTGQICVSGACQSLGCTRDEDCAPTDYCSSGSCLPKVPSGLSCLTPNMCLSGFCVDNVCCNASCDGICLTCADPTSLGTCVPAPTGTTCAGGTCDGAGACVSSCPDADLDGYTAAVCGGGDCNDTDASINPGAPEVCSDGLDNNCDGNVDEGCTCVNTQTQSCYSGPASTEGVGICTAGVESCSGGIWGPCVGEVTPSAEVCGDGLDNNCDGQVDEGCVAGSCTIDANCASTEYCSNNVCVPKLSSGSSCAAANECLSNFCTGGICCGTSCSGTCVSCSLSDSLGTCTALPFGTDCGGGSTCDGNGVCVVPGGCTTGAECDDNQVCTIDSCSAGACQHVFAPTGTACEGGGTCDGNGVCTPSACGAGQADCSGTCVDLSTDPQNCGSCGRACTVGQLCIAGSCNVCTDADLDGYYAEPNCGTPQDCDDTRATVHPGATEVCNGIDDNCDGNVDENFTLSIDPQNCGTCGNVCASGICVAGVCS